MAFQTKTTSCARHKGFKKPGRSMGRKHVGYIVGEMEDMDSTGWERTG